MRSGAGSYPQCPQDQAPLPQTPTPCYRHLFLRGRGRLTTNGIHLNLPLGLSNEPGPPQSRPRAPALDTRPPWW